MNLEIEPWQEGLFKPYRYKVIYGGRGSGKSYGVADALILISCTRKCLILCGREFQNSIKDSVHSLICQRIEALKLQGIFEVTHDEIRNTLSNSRFIFKGLRHNIDSIKSTAGITHLWIEEADTLSVGSWRVIKPTIRNELSEIWVTMNPKNKSDVLYKEFIESAESPKNAYIVKVNWQDNPYFPSVLKEEMERDKLRDYGFYRHVWEGECLEHSDAQIFKDKWEVQRFDEPKGIHKYFGLDFGFSQDPTAAICCYVYDNRLYISHEAVKIGLEIDDTLGFIEKRLPDLRRHTIYADNARPESISFLKRQGLSIRAVEKGKGSVEDGIAYIRSFDKVIIHENCLNTIKEFSLYSYKEDPRSGDITNTVVDKHNHCIDALRYALERSMKRKGCNYSKWDMEALANL
jgi:phage terminase large subunit